MTTLETVSMRILQQCSVATHVAIGVRIYESLSANNYTVAQGNNVLYLEVLSRGKMKKQRKLLFVLRKKKIVQ